MEYGCAEARQILAKPPNTTAGFPLGIPAVCDVSVTNVCNAACDFCGFSRRKKLIGPRRYLDRDAFTEAVPILCRRNIRYLTFQGGEPLLHPAIVDMVADASSAGIHVGLITNGWWLPQKIGDLVAAGLTRLHVSLDSHSMAEHERNRGLPRLGERIRKGVALASDAGLLTVACVTVNRLVHIAELPPLLRRLGFDSVDFSYPRHDPFPSSSLVYGDTSTLVDYSPEELASVLDEVKALKREFNVLNPTRGIEDVQRHLKGEPERFSCVGGHKYFYIDWDLNIWRCEAWHEPLGSVFDLDRIADERSHCTRCIMACYRNSSVLMHSAVAAADAAKRVAAGHPLQAASLLLRRSVAESVAALVESAPALRKNPPRRRMRWRGVRRPTRLPTVRHSLFNGVAEAFAGLTRKGCGKCWCAGGSRRTTAGTAASTR
jgi:MoaA/NifB/PqqE/SkfB family radical SAM enzyme